MRKKSLIIGIGITVLFMIGVVNLKQNSTLAEESENIVRIQDGSIIKENGIWENITSNSESIVRIQDGIIIEGNEILEKFISNSTAGNPDEIIIIDEIEGKIDKYTLKYNGNVYSYYDEDGTVSTKMKYLLDVSGTMPISEKESRKSRLVALANQEYTFDELFSSIISSNSNDFIDFEIIFWD